MIATVQLVDLGPADTLRAIMRRPKPGDTPGLTAAEVALFAPLALSGPPPIGRAGLIAFWDDDEAFDRFAGSDPIGRRFSGGFHARLRPLRAHGTWPGLPADVPTSRAVPHDGPVVVLTLGRLRVSQAVRFVRASRPAERAAAAHEGMIWGSAAVRPPFVATMSIWENAQATAAFAYGRQPARTQRCHQRTTAQGLPPAVGVHPVRPHPPGRHAAGVEPAGGVRYRNLTGDSPHGVG